MRSWGFALAASVMALALTTVVTVPVNAVENAVQSSVTLYSSAPTPTISGVARVGSALTASTGEWSPTPASLAYQWRINGNAIAGARGATFTIGDAQVGGSISVTVTATTSGFAKTSRTSASTAKVATDIATSRIQGADRYASANAIAEHSFPGGAPIVFVATGDDFPDAMAAAPVAAVLGGPVLLTEPGWLIPSVADEITRLAPTTIVIVGATASVSSAAEASLRKLAPKVRRIAGTDRYDTARALALYGFGSSGSDTAYITTGSKFPDALSAGSSAGSSSSPILLASGSRVDSATLAALRKLGTTRIKIVGDVNSVPASYAESLTGFSVTRLAGADRFATSVAVNTNGFSTSSVIYLATGYNFPDALAGSVLAADRNAALVVVQTGCVPTVLVDELGSLGVTHATLLGSSASLTQSVESMIPCGLPSRVTVPDTGATGPSGSYPDAETTGVPSGTSLTVRDGDLTVTAPGTVIDGMDIRGLVIVQAANVTIKNSIIRGRPVTGDAALLYNSGFADLVVEDSEIYAKDPSTYIKGFVGSNATFLRDDIHDVTDQVHIVGSNVTVKDSWLHDNLHFASDPDQGGGPTHDDNVQIQAGDNILIVGNTLSGSHNASLQVTESRGVPSNIVYSKNWASDGACTVNISQVGRGQPMSGVQVTSNLFGSSQYNCPVIVDSATEERATILGNSMLSGRSFTIVLR